MILMKSPAGQRRCQIGNSGHHKDGEGQKGIFPADIFREDDQYFQVSNIETEQGQKTDMVDGPEDPEKGVLSGKKVGIIKGDIGNCGNEKQGKTGLEDPKGPALFNESLSDQ
jgi:hypothetical protein